MGKILERFEAQTYRNEDEVKQNFLLPLFEGFLGYELTELVPEQKYPARDVHSGVYKIGDTKGLINKPDYVVCLEGDVDRPKFVIDAKGPEETIDEHLAQVKSYTLSVQVNLIVLTNGQELLVLDSNEPLFSAKNLHELEVQFDELYRILSRDSQSTKTLHQIIASINYSIALGLSTADVEEAEKLRRRAFIHGFRAYLENVQTDLAAWQLPYGSTTWKGMDVKPIAPGALYSLRLDSGTNEVASTATYSCNQLLNEFNAKVRIVLGESGIGKTTLLRYLAHSESSKTLLLEQTRIPVYVRLRQLSSGATLESLIQRELQSRGYQFTSLFSELTRYDFLLLLDGYDEIPKSMQASVSDEILALSRSSTCIVTTRLKEMVSLPVNDCFTIIPLDISRIGRVVREYLPHDHEKFFHEVDIRGLTGEMNNTLLLTLMLFLFEKDYSLPSSTGRIAQRIVSHIYDWTAYRSAGLELGFAQLDELLGVIAFDSIHVGEVELPREKVSEILAPELDRLQEERLIDASWTVDRAIEQLAATGLIVEADNRISFWHTTFRDYFASIALARRLQNGAFELSTLSQGWSWTRAIEGTPLFLADASAMVKGLLDDVWLAASCLLNAKYVDEACRAMLIDRLLQRCGSSVLEIRDRATFFLSKLNEGGTLHSVFIELFTSSPHEDVRMTALEQICSKGDRVARKLVLEHLDWKAGTGFFRYSSQVSVARALTHFGEAELLLIARLWEGKASMFDLYALEELCLKLLRQGRMTSGLLAELERIYLDVLNTRERSYYASHLACILIEAKDETFVDSLIATLERPDPEYTFSNQHTEEILLAYESELVVEKLQRIASDTSRTKEMRQTCGRILLKSRAKVPQTVYEELAGSDLLELQKVAVQSLGRFPISQVRERIESYFDSKEPQLQNEALSLIVENGELPSRLRDRRMPKMLYWPSLYTIVEAIARFAIKDRADLLDRIDQQVIKKGEEQHLVQSLVRANASIGRFDKAEQLVLDKYYDSGKLVWLGQFDLVRVMESVVVCRQPFATKVLLDAFAYIRQREPESGHFLEEKFIESVEQVPTSELKEALKEMVHLEIERRRSNDKYYMNIERLFRAFAKIGTDVDRSWTLDVLEHNPYWNPIDKKRAIECLSRYGTQEDLLVVQGVAQEYPADELVIATCLNAYEAILRRAGIRREVTDTDLFR